MDVGSCRVLCLQRSRKLCDRGTADVETGQPGPRPSSDSRRSSPDRSWFSRPRPRGTRLAVLSPMDTLLQDLRYALRSFSKAPGFTALALLTFAIGIGVNASVFGFVNALLLKPAPAVSDPESLVSVFTSDFSSGPYGDVLISRLPLDEIGRAGSSEARRVLGRIGGDADRRARRAGQHDGRVGRVLRPARPSAGGRTCNRIGGHPIGGATGRRDRLQPVASRVRRFVVRAGQAGHRRRPIGDDCRRGAGAIRRPESGRGIRALDAARGARQSRAAREPRPLHRGPPGAREAACSRHRASSTRSRRASRRASPATNRGTLARPDDPRPMVVSAAYATRPEISSRSGDDWRNADGGGRAGPADCVRQCRGSPPVPRERSQPGSGRPPRARREPGPRAAADADRKPRARGCRRGAGAAVCAVDRGRPSFFLPCRAGTAARRPRGLDRHLVHGGRGSCQRAGVGPRARFPWDAVARGARAPGRRRTGRSYPRQRHRTQRPRGCAGRRRVRPARVGGAAHAQPLQRARRGPGLFDSPGASPFRRDPAVGPARERPRVL